MLCVILDLVSYHHFPASVFIHQGKCLANSLALRWEKGDNRSLGERHHFLGVFTMKRKDITGQKFGRLTVVRYEGAAKNGNATWLCQCDCGQRTIVDGYRLRKGATTSCGCYRREVMREAIRKNPKTAAKIGQKNQFAATEGVNLNATLTVRSTNQSGVTGVSFDQQSGKWNARLFFKGQLVLNRTYCSFGEAVTARQRAERQYLMPLLKRVQTPEAMSLMELLEA